MRWLVSYRYDGPTFERIEIEAERVTAIREDLGSSLNSIVVITADHVTFRLHASVNADIQVENLSNEVSKNSRYLGKTATD